MDSINANKQRGSPDRVAAKRLEYVTHIGIHLRICGDISARFVRTQAGEKKREEGAKKMKEKKRRKKNDGGGGEVAKGWSFRGRSSWSLSDSESGRCLLAGTREIYIFYLAAETCAAFFESDERKALLPSARDDVHLLQLHRIWGFLSSNETRRECEVREKERIGAKEAFLRCGKFITVIIRDWNLAAAIGVSHDLSDDKSLNANCCSGRLIRHAKRRGSDLSLKGLFHTRDINRTAVDKGWRLLNVNYTTKFT